MAGEGDEGDESGRGVADSTPAGHVDSEPRPTAEGGTDMLVILQEVLNAPISGTGSTTVYTPSELNSVLAQGETFWVSARTTQVSGTSPTITVAIEHSNDGVNWTNKATPISAQSLSANAVNLHYGQDTGSTPTGGFVRLAITLAGTNPSGQVQVIVAGRASEGPRVLYHMKVFDGAISGTGTTTVYTDPSLGSQLAQADKLFVHARVTQVSGTSPTLTIGVQTSNDGGVNFDTSANQKATPINGTSLTANSVNNIYGSDTNTNIGGGFYRFAVTLGGTNPSAQVELYVCGREA